MIPILAIALALGGLQEEKKNVPGWGELKALAGTWESTDPEHPATVTYKVSSGGSVVVESMSHPGHAEMLTVYHADGEDLVLTHYCMLGNQPRMRAERTPTPGVLRFVYDGGSNLKPGDKHMHALTLTFVDADHLKEDWVLYDQGKEVNVVTINLARRKE